MPYAQLLVKLQHTNAPKIIGTLCLPAEMSYPCLPAKAGSCPKWKPCAPPAPCTVPTPSCCPLLGLHHPAHVHHPALIKVLGLGVAISDWKSTNCNSFRILWHTWPARQRNDIGKQFKLHWMSSVPITWTGVMHVGEISQGLYYFASGYQQVILMY